MTGFTNTAPAVSNFQAPSQVKYLSNTAKYLVMHQILTLASHSNKQQSIISECSLHTNLTKFCKFAAAPFNQTAAVNHQSKCFPRELCTSTNHLVICIHLYRLNIIFHTSVGNISFPWYIGLLPTSWICRSIELKVDNRISPKVPSVVAIRKITRYPLNGQSSPSIEILQHNKNHKSSLPTKYGNSTGIYYSDLVTRYVASDTPHNPRWNDSRLLLFHLPTDVPH